MQDVALLGVLGQAGGGAEGEHLAAPRPPSDGWRAPPGASAGNSRCSSRSSAGLVQRAEVDDRHVGAVIGQRAGELLVRDAAGDEPEVGVLVDQRPQAAGDDVLELGQGERDRLAVGDGHSGGGGQGYRGGRILVTGVRTFYHFRVTRLPPIHPTSGDENGGRIRAGFGGAENFPVPRRRFPPKVPDGTGKEDEARGQPPGPRRFVQAHMRARSPGRPDSAGVSGRPRLARARP